MSEHCCHTHEHTHEATGAEEKLALLKYMAQHNSHHAQELHSLAHGATDEAETLLHEAVAKLQESTALLNRAIELLEG